MPVNQGAGPGLTARTLGGTGGQESVTLTVDELPTHSHPAQASDAAGVQTAPAGGVWAASTGGYAAPGEQATPMAANALAPAGGGAAHENMLPFLATSYCIAFEGIYPSPE